MLLFGHIGLTLGILYLVHLLTRRNFSYPLIIIGSILPDLIDKPLGRVILPLGSGRLIGHTLIFLLILVFIGLFRGILVLALASALHLIEDRMWDQPAILLWPILGGFQIHQAISLNNYISGLTLELYPSLSTTFISEAAGFVIVLAFFAFWAKGHLRSS
jgi:hypothetical protein